ncbi:MAG: polyhydroxyalkanoic acid system family protein [Pseudomonadota bacterium]|nr:polyhydroxyalkanoic acid system family protein [Pseudomonadota bacterium]
MADIQIEREHGLGLREARKIALKWAAQAEEKFALTCRYEEGQAGDLLSFSRPGFDGTLTVSPERFELSASLGLMVSLFKADIEGKLLKQFDKLLAPQPDTPVPGSTR